MPLNCIQTCTCARDYNATERWFYAITPLAILVTPTILHLRVGCVVESSSETLALWMPEGFCSKNFFQMFPSEKLSFEQRPTRMLCSRSWGDSMYWRHCCIVGVHRWELCQQKLRNRHPLRGCLRDCNRLTTRTRWKRSSSPNKRAKHCDATRPRAPCHTVWPRTDRRSTCDADWSLMIFVRCSVIHAFTEVGVGFVFKWSISYGPTEYMCNRCACEADAVMDVHL